VHYGNTLRIILTGAIAALAVAAPVAVAKPASTSGVAVCNTATHTSLGGWHVATDGDTAPPARYQNNLKPMKGHGAGLVKAAANSPALSLCVVPSSEPDTGGDDGGDLGGIAA
jgi:hypothetical protein